MPIFIASAYTPSVPSNLDTRLGPYSSSAHASSSIDENYRYPGMTVFVSSSAEQTEYWWKDGLQDTDLIVKETGGNFTSYNFTASFNNQSTWTVNHNLDYQYVIIQTFDTSGNQIIPSEITLTSTNTATATFPEATSGTAVVTFGGATFNNPILPVGVSNAVQYNNGGVFGGSSKFQFTGNGLQLLNNDESAYALETITDKYYINSNIFFNRLLHQPTIQGYINDKKYSGDILTPETSAAATPYDLVNLGEAGSNWTPVDQTTDSSTRMLGILYGSDTILIDGYIIVGDGTTSGVPTIDGTLERGSPVYINEGAISSPFLSTDRPTTGYVRILGHLIQPSGDYWLMRFRPDNYWEEL